MNRNFIIRLVATFVFIMGVCCIAARLIDVDSFPYILGGIFTLIFIFQILLTRVPDKKTKRLEYRISLSILFGLFAYLFLVVARSVYDIGDMMAYFVYTYGVLELVFVLLSLEKFKLQNISLIIGNSMAGFMHFLVGAFVIHGDTKPYFQLFLVGLILILGAMRHIIFRRVIPLQRLVQIVRKNVTN